jgi:hypothetical protein
MSSITTRAAKGSALTHAEVDANFTNLNSGKAEVSGQTFTGAVVLPAGSATAGGVQVGTGATYKPSIYSPGTDQLAISTGGTGRWFVDASGRVLVGTSTANTSGAKLQTSDGLTFPVTQVASADPNTLDDYEEGTWTPTVVGTATAGTVAYSNRIGNYVKTGRFVTATGTVGWSAGTGTGDLQITGLPFTTNASTGFASVSFGYVEVLSLTALNYVLGYVAPNSSAIVIAQSPTGGGSITTVAYDATVTLVFSCSYLV